MSDERLDATFAALAHPVRRDILARLRGGATPVTRLAASYELSLPSISRHLDVLEDAGLVSRTAAGRTRVCKATPGALDDALAWLSEHRRFWSGTLDALAAHLERLSAPGARSGAPRRGTRRGGRGRGRG